MTLRFRYPPVKSFDAILIDVAIHLHTGPNIGIYQPEQELVPKHFSNTDPFVSEKPALIWLKRDEHTMKRVLIHTHTHKCGVVISTPFDQEVIKERF